MNVIIFQVQWLGKWGDYLEIENLAGVYKEIACSTDIEVAVEMYNLFKGQQIIFPQRLYNKEFICTYVKNNYNGHNIRELSQMFGYSDRRIRQILGDKKEGLFRAKEK